jgi:hypothetical protein
MKSMVRIDIIPETDNKDLKISLSDFSINQYAHPPLFEDAYILIKSVLEAKNT